MRGAKYLPPANEVWGKVICLQACVCPQGGCLVRGVLAPEGACSQRGLVWVDACSGGVPGVGGCLVWGVPGLGGAWSGGCLLPGGCLVETGTATAADGTHPTGMHSCLTLKFAWREKRKIMDSKQNCGAKRQK